MEECIFCKIINKELPANIIYEDDEVLVFETNKPMAPIHVLIVPREHIESVDKLNDAQAELAGKLILVGRSIARDLKISENGYKMMFHVGKHGGQEINHLHLHLLGGAMMEAEIKIIKD